ncbi:MaoC family dehydratase [Hoeflea poritis]|uniref:MaoC family dehydratase n=1 Tax=Hoeflea poritis TaxID=2993659 RepID=A0ABT4VKC8_9HYPH|nr:MaoC family dehydratase [Hoeflea poritis]MDA4845144.1 MaoC family dehydratase [Hoeflea poritis]
MNAQEKYPDSYTLENIEEHIGRTFGPGSPIPVGQDRINEFAEVTEDRQWIHTDVARANERSPFGGTIAHGYLTLSLLAAEQMKLGLIPKGCSGAMNYGLDKVRFLAPVPSGADLRVSAVLTGIERKEGGRVLIRSKVTAQAVGASGPALIADTLALAFR